MKDFTATKGAPVWARSATALRDAATATGRAIATPTGTTVAVSVFPATVVTGCANLAAHQLATVPNGLMAAVVFLASGYLGVKGLAHKWSPAATWSFLGLSVATLDIGVAVAGHGWADVIAGGLFAVASLGGRLAYLHGTADQRLKKQALELKAQAEEAKANAVLAKTELTLEKVRTERIARELKAAQLAKLEEPEYRPNLVGHTAEESRFRMVFWDLFKAELLSFRQEVTKTGYAATIGLPIGLPRDQVRSQWNKIESALQTNGHFILSNSRLSNEIQAQFIDPATADVAPLTGWQPGDCWAVVADTGEEVPVPLGRRMLFAGTSGSGKSWSARPLLAEASEYPDHRLVVIDLKQAEARNWQHRARIATEAEQIEAVLEELFAEGEDRLKTVPRGRDTVAISSTLPRITVFVDEGGELLSALEDATIDRLRTIARKYRAAEIILVWATQKPTLTGNGNGLDSQISAQLTHKLSLTTATPQESRTIFGEDAGEKGWDAHELPLKGWALLRDIETQSKPARLRMRAMSPADVVELPDRPVWFRDGDRSFSGDAQYQLLAGGSSFSAATPEDRIERYFLAKPDGSIRGAAKELDIPESTIRRIVKSM